MRDPWPPHLQALVTLADRAEGDVRCCLNTLQFLGRQRGAVRAADVASATAGHKDVSTSAFAVWQQLLWQRVRAPRPPAQQPPAQSRLSRQAMTVDLTVLGIRHVLPGHAHA